MVGGIPKPWIITRVIHQSPDDIRIGKTGRPDKLVVKAFISRGNDRQDPCLPKGIKFILSFRIIFITDPRISHGPADTQVHRVDLHALFRKIDQILIGAGLV